MRKVKKAATKKIAESTSRCHAGSSRAAMAQVETLEPRLMMTGMLYVVNSLTDTVASDGYLTLREAIQAANTDAAVNEAPAGTDNLAPDSITFDPSLFSSGAVNIVLSGTELQITESLIITGPGQDLLSIDGAGLSRVFETRNSPTGLSLYGLTIKGGHAVDNGGGGVYASTGTSVSLVNCTLSGNSAIDYGGGLYGYKSTVAMENCTVSGNTASYGGGVFAGYNSFVSLTSSMVSNNTASYYGGGVYTEALSFVVLTNSTVNRNNSGEYGGGLWVAGGSYTTLTNSTISGNSAYSDGGGVFIDSGATATLNNTIVSVNDSTSDADLFGTYDGTGNFIGGDPGFVRNPSAGTDGIWGTADDDPGDLHLQTGSQCIDGGINSLAVDAGGSPLTTDLNGRPRIIGESVDVGAYEHSGNYYVVNSLSDMVYLDGFLTLREAIQAANTDAAVNEAPAGSSSYADIITFDPALFSSGQRSIVLSGTELDITESLTINGPGQDLLSIDGAGLSRVFEIGGITAVSMDGLAITGGYSTDNGGGLRVDSGILTITNCTVSGNTASGTYGNGGGIWNSGAVINLIDSTVSGNTASDTTGVGGGLGAISGTVTLTNCTVNGNSAAFGGGLYGDIGSILNLTDSTVNGNSSVYFGGGLTLYNSGTATLTNSTVSGNSSSGNGGGLYLDAGGTVTLTNSTISGNSATDGYGGGLGLYGSGIATLTNSTVSGNSASGNGGGIYVDGVGTVTLTNSTISGNTANSSGGGVCLLDGTATLTNCTVSGNSAGFGGGVNVYYGYTATLNNTIVAVNDAPIDADVEGPYDGSGNFVGGDPKFVRNPSAGTDGTWGTADDDLGDLHLQAGSPCINAGLTYMAVDASGNPLTTDLDGNARVFGSAVDIGAYESTAQAQSNDISGRIVDATSGAALGDIWVYLYQGNDPDHAGSDAWDFVDSAQTDADGNYTFTNVTPRTYVLRTDDQEIGNQHYLASYQHDVTVVDGSTISDMNLQAHRAGELFGYVYDSAGHPIPGAEVVTQVQYTQDGDDWHTATTGPDGRYELYVAPTTQKFYPVKILEASAQSTGQHYAVQIASGLYSAQLSGTHGPDFHLSLGGTIHGTVVDGMGNPVTYTNVVDPYGQIPGGTFQDPSAQTDGDGKFWLNGVPANTDIYLDTRTGNWVDGGTSNPSYAWGDRLIGPFRVSAGQTLDVGTLTMPLAGSVHGTIRDGNGNGVAGVKVALRGIDASGADMSIEDEDMAVTDSLGNYVFNTVPAGVASIRVNDDGWIPALSDSFIVQGGQDTAQDLVIHTAGEGGAISGTISNYTQVAPHNADGVLLPFELSNNYSDYGYGDSIGVVSYPESMQWTLEDWLVPGGRMPDGNDVTDGFADYFAASATPGGSFATTLPVGRQVVLSYRDLPNNAGGILSDPLILDVTPGSQFSNLSLTFPTGSGVVCGTVSFPSDYTLPSTDSAHVWVREDGSASMARAVATVQPDGSYNLPGLPDGNYNLLFCARGLQPATASITISNGQTIVRNVTLQSPVVWDIGTGYSTTSNPNGVWSYGRNTAVEGGSFDLMTVQWGDSGWYLGNYGNGGPSIQFASGAPEIWAKDNGNGYPDIRWTCPAAGSYDLAVKFIGDDSRGTDNLVYVTVNGVIRFSGHVKAYQDTVDCSLSDLQLNAGDHVDFLAVWNGGVYSEYGWTQVAGTIATHGYVTAPPPEVLSMSGQAGGTVTIDFDQPMRTDNVRDQWNVLVVDTADPTRLISGQVLWNQSATSLTWEPDLAAGGSATWRITLVAQNSGDISSADGSTLLDGDGDTLPGGNFIATWAVYAAPAVPLQVSGFNAAADGTITFNFSNRVLTSIVNPNWDIVVTDSADNRVSGAVTWSNDNCTMTWQPDSPPTQDDQWTITMGANAPREFVDVAMNGLDGDAGGTGGVSRTWTVSANAAPSGQILPDRYESNDTVATATALDVSAGPQSFRGLTIYTAADVDWFSFTTYGPGTDSDRVFIDADVHGGSLTLDLCDTEGNVLQSGAPDPLASPAGAVRTMVNLSGLPAGEYTIEVAGGVNPSYDLTIQPPLKAAGVAALAAVRPAAYGQMIQPNVAAGDDKWTVLYYVAGDNNLDEDYYNELDQMERLDMPSSVNVAVEYDRLPGISPQWAGTIKYDWSDTRRGFMVHDDTPSQLGSWLGSSTTLGELDMSSSATLANFITWATTTRPASHYVLNIVNHGDGVAGVCQDQTSGTAMLNPHDVSSAMSAAGVHFDVLVMDTCLMGMAEMASAVASNADYMVATEEATYTGSMPAQLSLLESSGSTPWTGESLAVAIAQATADLHPQKNQAFGHDFYTTESVLDLSKVAALNQAIRSFVQTTNAAAPQGATSSSAQWSHILAAVNAATSFLNANNRDLGQFMQAVKNDAAIAPSIRAAAGAVLAAMGPAVVANYSNGGNADGLAVTLTSSLSWNYDSFASDFVTATAWDQFLNNLLIADSGRNFSADWAEPNNFEDQAYFLHQVQGAVTLPELTIDSPGDKDYFLLDLGATGDAQSSITIIAVDASGNPDATWAPSLEVYEANGVRVPISASGTAGVATVSLDGKPAGLYYVRVASDGVACGRYEMTISAPLSQSGTDWVGDNNQTPTSPSDQLNPYPLKLVPGKVTPWVGLLASSTGNWFEMDLGNLNNGPDGFIEMGSAGGANMTIRICDQAGNTLMTASGADERFNIPRNTAGQIYIEVLGATASPYTLTVKSPSYQVYSAPVLLQEWSFGSAHVAVYGDNTGIVVNPSDIAVVFAKNGGGVTSITLGKTTPTANLGIVVWGASSVGSIKDTRKAGNVSFIASSCPVSTITLSHSLLGTDIDGLTMGGITLPADIDGDGKASDETALYLPQGAQKGTTLTVSGAMGGDVFAANVKSLTVKGSTSNSYIVLSGVSVPTMKFAGVNSVSISSSVGIKSISAINWLDSQGGSAITAPSLASLTIAGAKGVSGDMAANLNIGNILAPGALGTVKVAGSINSRTWNVSGNVGAVTVGGQVDQFSLRATGSLAGVTLGASYNSDFMAGVADDCACHAGQHSDFINSLATLKSFTIKGIKGKPTGTRFFTDNNLSAATIGPVTILNGDFTDTDPASRSGIWASNAVKTPIKSVTNKDAVDKTKTWSWPPKANKPFAGPADLIQII